MRLVAGTATVDDPGAFVERLQEAGRVHGCAVQVFDARLVAGREHLAAAVEGATRAFERGENVADEFAVEVLLYAAGRRQIDRALEMGVGAGEGAVAGVVVGRATDADEAAAAEAVAAHLDAGRVVGPDETLDAGDPTALRAFFEVGDAEVRAHDGPLADLVRERVALLDVRK